MATNESTPDPWVDINPRTLEVSTSDSLKCEVEPLTALREAIAEIKKELANLKTDIGLVRKELVQAEDRVVGEVGEALSAVGDECMSLRQQLVADKAKATEDVQGVLANLNSKARAINDRINMLSRQYSTYPTSSKNDDDDSGKEGEEAQKRAAWASWKSQKT